MDRVTFPNRDNTVVGNLFTPSRLDAGKKYPAIVVTHPFGAVKEQVSTLYAEKLTEQGFITLVFDASYQGESGGEPHFSELPAVRVEDIRCAVDFLASRPQVDEDRIGALGICAGGGYTINAAQTELRIKAVAGVSVFDIGSARREGVGGGIPFEARMKTLEEVGRQRTREAQGEPLRYVSLVPDDPQQALNNPSDLYREGYIYYTQAAPHPNAMEKFVFTTLGPQMAFFPFEQIETISPRPLLIIAGSEADTRYFSENAYAKAKEPKELHLVPGATHIDLYYKPEFVPQVAEKLTQFFGTHL
ncbi:alpha/beta hydrolase [Streptomyces sp. NPDC006872]|uniref:alpha/beta hydrolase n=1 Tax=Streptomyces sp. NPDC006872 TaxID=3155720 RepID=UPI0033EC0273